MREIHGSIRAISRLDNVAAGISRESEEPRRELIEFVAECSLFNLAPFLW